MIKAEIRNCNNVTSATIQLKKNHLNICYAMNGTGKSTIASAIDLTSKKESLDQLKPFDGEIEPSCTLSEPIDNVLLFNDNFVNNFVFQESEVIQNSFEVFIKTPEYERRQQSINKRLKNIHIDVNENPDLQAITTVGRYVLSKFTETISGDLKQQGLIKSLTKSGSMFKLPNKLVKFQPLMEKKYNVEWVGWKNDGSKFDDNGICPFCTTGLSKEYQSEKDLFSESYSKSNMKNITEMLSYFNEVKQLMDEEAKEKLDQCIKGLKTEEEIQLWIKRFYYELKFLVNKISNVLEFNSYQVKREDIAHLDAQLKQLLIDISDLKIFNNKKVNDSIDFINHRIAEVIKETDLLKREIGELKGLIGDAKENAIKDINDFLFTACINYSFEILDEAENTSRTILRYKSQKTGPVEVENINIHLSWGEKNAFALVLFMHYASSQNPDIIILDDPISSFDSNKKYAIIDRLFTTNHSKKARSFYQKTVLLLTHDLQPIIDFVLVNKPDIKFVSAHFLQNKVGIITEQEITDKDIKSLPILLAENSKNDELSKVHRVVSLRKLLEYTLENGAPHIMAYNLLSCLLHGKPKASLFDGIELTPVQISLGETKIKEYIADFEYNNYLKTIFIKASLLKAFVDEPNPYIRLQIFRVIVTILQLKAKIKDNPLVKYIDEQFHVENDYMFTLDFIKYDLVPDFIVPKCIECLQKEKLIT